MTLRPTGHLWWTEQNPDIASGLKQTKKNMLRWNIFPSDGETTGDCGKTKQDAFGVVYFIYIWFK